MACRKRLSSWAAAARPVDELDEKIEGLAGKLATSAREHEETARLMTIPEIGLS